MDNDQQDNGYQHYQCELENRRYLEENQEYSSIEETFNGIIDQ